MMFSLRRTSPLILAALLGGASAHAESTRYRNWQPPVDETVKNSSTEKDNRLQNMVDELNKLIDDAARARAADRLFIQDLRDIVNQYDWPWRTNILTEDFTDGVIPKTPQWKITKGDFEIKRGLGLHSNIKSEPPPPQKKASQQDAAAALIGALLDQALKTREKDSSEASAPEIADTATIYTGIKINNAFAIKLDIDVRGRKGLFEIGLYQGEHTGAGYRLAFIPGKQSSIEIQRVSKRGVSVIHAIDNLGTGGNKTHQIQWTRDKTGNMKVSLNGKEVMLTSDRSFKDAFSGFVMSNRGGKFAVQKVSISGI